MEWKNFGYDIYKEIKGEEEFNRKIEEANTIPPSSIFDRVSFRIEKEKIKFIFGVSAVLTGNRPTHPDGVGAQGIATIVADPQFPECEFFTPGRSYPVCIRHATLKDVDDAGLVILGGSIRFADSNAEGPLDIIMSTGRSAVFCDVQSIYDVVEANRSKDLKTYFLKKPDYLAGNIDSLRRRPESFFDQRYHSQIILDFKALDGVKRFARFRLMPADGTPETGLLSEEDQRNAWNQKRLPSETKSHDYLTEEWKERLSRGPLKYKLQMTLHQPRSDDPPDILNIARHWDEATHPWLDVAHLTVAMLLSPDVTEEMRFNPGNLSSCLAFLPAHSIHHPNCIVHIRKELYERAQILRSLGNSSHAPDYVATYTVNVETGSQSRAGTNARISMSLTGTRGKTGKIPLGSWRNDFEEGRTDEYTVQAMDVGEVLIIQLYNDGSGLLKTSDWFVNKIVITSSTQDKAFHFPCYRWIVSDMVIFQGKAFLPFKDQPEVMRAQRVLEIQQRKQQYQWGQLPPGVVDLPGFVHAPKHSDLPRDAQFSDEASRSFHRGALKGAVNLGLSYLYTLFDSWDNFDSFKKIFTGWTGDVPKISHGDVWMEDRVFGNQFLNGCNPCVIEKCNELPSNFPVTHSMVKNGLDRGMTLEEEIKAGHVYIVDYKELEGIKRGGEDGNSKYRNYAAEPLCLFYVKSSGDLVPIAIQLFQEPSDTNPIWTPDDSKYDWLLAKMWFRNADHQVHQMRSHLMRTHLIVEAFAVASWRQLPSIHPVFQLLFPHLRSVMAINTIGRNELIAKGGIIDKTLSIGGGGHIQLLEKTYKNFKFEMLSFPAMLKERGVDDIKNLPNYYYRDDGLLLWNAISHFIGDVMQIFYHTDDEISKDIELQSWVMDIHENGFPVRDGDVDHEFPKCIQTREQLVHLLTCVVFTCSCQHAAVNFPQMEITSFVPNIPTVMRLPPPTRKNETTLKSIMDTLPNKSQAGWHIATVYTLTRIAEDERFIGDYSQSLLSGEAIEGAISRFQASLQQISDDIKLRNSNVEFPYEHLLPERVPNSIAI